METLYFSSRNLELLFSMSSIFSKRPDFCKGCIRRLSFETNNLESRIELRSRQTSYAGPEHYVWRDNRLQEDYYTIPKLEERREKGCRLCSLILRAFTREQALMDWVHLSTITTYPEERHGRVSRHLNKPKIINLIFKWSLGGRVVFADESKTKTVAIHMVEVEQQRNLPMATIRSPLYKNWTNTSLESTSSAPSIDQVSGWIDFCEGHHDCSKVQRQDHFLTTRLVELVRGVEKLRLRNSADLPPVVRYATLSHCWGEGFFMQLLKENLLLFSNDIRFLDLPQTFQDAITVVSKLPVNYIWIDSLCIIQDSDSDWEFEAARMSKVYANSYLNLAATASRNAYEGLFRIRNPYSIKRCRYAHDEGRYMRALDSSRQEPPTKWDCVIPSEWVTSIVEAPLNSRAWVYQERALAPRVLHFATSELFWECNHTRASETYPDGLPKQYVIPKQKNLLYGYSRQGRTDLFQPKDTLTEATSLGRFLNSWINQRDGTPLDIWTLIVEDYSSAKLTYVTDKLVAISALAQTFAEQYAAKYVGPPQKIPLDQFVSETLVQPKKNEVVLRQSDSTTPSYLAGLWDHQFLEQLLWHVKKHLPCETIGPNPYIAPSWSWASVTHPVDYSPIRRPRRTRAFASEVITATTTLANNTFGAVTSGSLVIRGPIFRANFSSNRDTRYEHHSTNFKVGTREDYYASLDNNYDLTGLEIFCLPLFIHPGDMASHFEMEGLLLVPGTGGYRRIGTFSQTPLHCYDMFREIHEAQKCGFLKGTQPCSTVGWREFLGDCNRFVKDDSSFDLQVKIFELSII